LALEIRFFMAAEDERELLRRLEPLRLELWPVFSDAGMRAPLVSAETELNGLDIPEMGQLGYPEFVFRPEIAYSKAA